MKADWYAGNTNSTRTARIRSTRYPSWLAITYTEAQPASRPARRNPGSRKSRVGRHLNWIERKAGHRTAVIATTPRVVPAPSTHFCRSVMFAGAAGWGPGSLANTRNVAVAMRLFAMGANMGAANRRFAFSRPV